LPALAHPEPASNQNEEHVMIALGLVRVIEQHSDELAAELIAKLETSSRTSDLRKVPDEELRRGLQEILLHLGEWLLTKTSHDIEKRYFKLGERRASQGVAPCRLVLGNCSHQGASLGIPATPGRHGQPDRKLWRDGIVATAGPVC
jgi:hypothetical protein